MMLSTGIPELREEADINYLRDAFSLGLTDEQAAKKMESLINESLKSKATQLNNAIHIFAHPDKDS
jgi:phosphatidylinositol-4,5-bisphosphate 3-kinase catalytic subunit alpha/beta/delta